MVGPHKTEWLSAVLYSEMHFSMAAGTIYNFLTFKKQLKIIIT